MTGALIAHLVKCRSCKGSGKKNGEPCARCEGTGIAVVGSCLCCEVDAEEEPD